MSHPSDDVGDYDRNDNIPSEPVTMAHVHQHLTPSIEYQYPKQGGGWTPREDFTFDIGQHPIRLLAQRHYGQVGLADVRDKTAKFWVKFLVKPMDSGGYRYYKFYVAIAGRIPLLPFSVDHVVFDDHEAVSFLKSTSVVTDNTGGYYNAQYLGSVACKRTNNTRYVQGDFKETRYFGGFKVMFTIKSELSTVNYAFTEIGGSNAFTEDLETTWTQ